jgi:hypothetical protein
MNIVLINDEIGVEVYKNWAEVKKYSSFKKEDFTQLGADYVLNCNQETYEISKDIKMIERVASERVFAKNKMSGIDMAVLGCFLMCILIYLK